MDSRAETLDNSARFDLQQERGPMAKSDGTPPIPAYHLYGDAQRDVELDSVHVEPIRFRSSRHDWTIAPHVHPDHAQVLWFTEGWAKIWIEDRVLDVKPPCLVVHPAGMVHEIRYEPNTGGRAATVARTYVDRVARDDPRLGAALLDPGAWRVMPGSESHAILDHAFDRLLVEFGSTDPGRRMAIQAHFTTILVELVRLRATEADAGPGRRDRDLEIVTRYRELLEARFRDEKMLGFYAGQLGVSIQRLNAACKARAGRTASEVLYDRLVIEAKRGLIYTEMTVAELAHSLGFDDAAYFNRFFSRRIGTPPGVYRAEAAATRRVGS
jgi:AraC family transcriptional activator of pobA